MSNLASHPYDTILPRDMRRSWGSLKKTLTRAFARPCTHRYLPEGEGGHFPSGNGRVRAELGCVFAALGITNHGSGSDARTVIGCLVAWNTFQFSLRLGGRTFLPGAVSNMLEAARSAVDSAEPAVSPRTLQDRGEADEDREIVRRIKQGEKDLFARLVVKYQSRIFSLAARILGSPEDAEEVTNDSFVAAYKQIRRFREEARFYSWLYRIATNQALNRLRHDRRRGRGKESSLECLGEESGFDPPDAETVAGTVEKREWKHLIEAAIRKLPEPYRVVVVLRDVEGQSYQEVVERTGLPLGTVKSRLHTARAILHKELGKYL